MPSICFQPNPTNGKDSYIASDAPTVNIGTADRLYYGENVGSDATYRSLVQFDISSIPSDATISAATLSLWVRGQPVVTRILRVFRLKRAWTELGVTWNKYDGTNDWQTAGGSGANDREATDIGSLSISSSSSQHDQKDFTLDPAKIQEMISGGVFTNNGFLLQYDTESNDIGDFYSSDETTFTSERPMLCLTYTTPTTTSTTTSTSTTTTSTSTTTTSTSTTTTSTSTTTTSTSTTTTSTSTTTTSTSSTTSTSTSTSTSTTTTTTSTTMPYHFEVDHGDE